MLLMNRFRSLTGPNSYTSELRRNPLELIPPGGRWLDVGCGTGVAVRQAAAMRQDVTVVALDLESGFVDGLPVAANLRFLQASASSLPLRGTFDLITAVHVLHFIDDKQACLEQLADRLAPGGTLLANFDPSDVWIGPEWEEARPLQGEPMVLEQAIRWGRFQGARSFLGSNRQGVTSRQSLYL